MKKNVLIIGLFALCAYSFAEDSVRLSALQPVGGVAVLSTDTLYLQNMNITTSASYQSMCIRVGNHVTTQQTQGDVNVVSGKLTLTGDEVLLEEGTTIAVGAELEINN